MAYPDGGPAREFHVVWHELLDRCGDDPWTRHLLFELDAARTAVPTWLLDGLSDDDQHDVLELAMDLRWKGKPPVT